MQEALQAAIIKEKRVKSAFHHSYPDRPQPTGRGGGQGTPSHKPYHGIPYESRAHLAEAEYDGAGGGGGGGGGGFTLRGPYSREVLGPASRQPIEES